MSCYTTRTSEDRKTIQQLWEAGVRAKDIADKLNASLSSVYSELRRGQDGSRLQNQRLRYNADLAQLRLQQSFERRGLRTGEKPDRKESRRRRRRWERFWPLYPLRMGHGTQRSAKFFATCAMRKTVRKTVRTKRRETIRFDG